MLLSSFLCCIYFRINFFACLCHVRCIFSCLLFTFSNFLHGFRCFVSFCTHFFLRAPPIYFFTFSFFSSFILSPHFSVSLTILSVFYIFFVVVLLALSLPCLLSLSFSFLFLQCFRLCLYYFVLKFSISFFSYHVLYSLLLF